MKELICIVCPKGCHLKVDEDNDYKVTGNNCPRGAEYGKKELTHPMRVITSSIRIQGGTQARVSVKTSTDIPKEKIWDIMKRLDEVEVEAPVHRGDIIEKNICGTQANLVITKDVNKI